MARRALVSLSVVAALVTGGCTSADGSDEPVAAAPPGLCAKIGGDLLRKLAPMLDVEKTPGDDRSCFKSEEETPESARDKVIEVAKVVLDKA